MENKIIIGIIAIIFGIFIMIFPYVGLEISAILTGIGILILAIYFLIAGTSVWSTSKAASIVYVIIGIIGLFAGMMLIGNVPLFKVLVSFYLYITGFMLLIGGIAGLFSRSDMMVKASAVLMLILGVVTVVLGLIAFRNVYIVAIILGISLVIEGISLIVGK